MTRNSSARSYRGIEVALSLCTGSIHAHDLQKKIDMVVDAVQVAPKLLDFDPKTRLVIRPIKGNCRNGQYIHVPGTPLIEVDPRNTIDKVLETVMHELVHAEQYHTKKLRWNGRQQEWKGCRFRKPTTYEAYRRLPWEVEAFGRSPSLVDEVCKMKGWASFGQVQQIRSPIPVQVQPKAPVADPDVDLKVDLREELLKEGRFSVIVIDNLVANDTLNQARRLGLI